MLIFASSDKGGTGRTVTTCNVAHQLSLRGRNVAYLDFDFGSPTAGAIYEIDEVERGAASGGLHSYLQTGAAYKSFDVRRTTTRQNLRTTPTNAGRMVLIPGDRGGGEFPMEPEATKRVVTLLAELDRQYHVTIVDLSSGRSSAVQMALHALASKQLARAKVRWLVFHRWTRQHVLAASGLLYDESGILQYAVEEAGLDAKFQQKVKTVRTAVPNLMAAGSASSGAQATWLQEFDQKLDELARDRRLGPAVLLGTTPMEPILQWREQLLLGADVAKGIANGATVEAFARIAADLEDERHWTPLGEEVGV
jgi:hypothetical protein